MKNAVDESEPEPNRILGFLDPRRQNRREKEDGEISSLGGDDSSDQRMLASPNTKNKGESIVRDNFIKTATTISQETNPLANKLVQEILPELPSEGLGRNVNYEGTGPLDTVCDKIDKSPRKNNELGEETCQNTKSEDVTGQSEQSASLLVNGNCLPGNISEDTENLRKDDCTNPEPDVPGNLVSLETTDSQGRHDVQENKYEKFFSRTKVPEPSESFCCKICSFVSSNPKDFLLHMKEHNSGPPYHCPQCDYAPNDHSCFLNHLYWHAGHELYQCNFCAFLSFHSNSMVMHSYLHTDAKPYLCAICQLRFRNASGLNRHTGTHYREQNSSSLHVAQEKDACPLKTYACDECNMVFYTQALLQSHKKCHVEKNGHDEPSVNVPESKTQGTACEQEDSSWKKKMNSRNSLAGKKSESFRHMYTCDRCSLAFQKEEHLVYHQAAHVQVQPGENGTCNDQQAGGDKKSPKVQSAGRPALKRFKCLQCSYMTSLFGNLRVHLTVHTGEKPFKCQECDKSFRNASHLKRHSLLHTENRHKCSGCRFVGCTAKDLKLHEETCEVKGPAGKRSCPSTLRCEISGEEINRGETNRSILSQSRACFHNCEHCAYSTYSLDNLKIHRRIHTGEKPYTCSVCQKKFRTSSHLRRHALVHVEQKFKCSNCDCSASTWLSFKRHMASHGGAHLPHGSQSEKEPPPPIKMYRCEKCSYSTLKKENLKVHFRIHTGERPYECPHCSRAFRTSSQLKKHLLTHLKLQCGKCEFSTLDERALQKHAQTHKKKKKKKKKEQKKPQHSTDQEHSTTTKI
ncbi:uncharacterized protein LOC143827794 isoform X2 [Paroedura picta]|uniref:uncharacterized protein LOC143827794 isoform X2 n=1 Tax=Paroedura picta TaxID=143630 RepID=UPI004055A9E9